MRLTKHSGILKKERIMTNLALPKDLHLVRAHEILFLDHRIEDLHIHEDFRVADLKIYFPSLVDNEDEISNLILEIFSVEIHAKDNRKEKRKYQKRKYQMSTSQKPSKYRFLTFSMTRLYLWGLSMEKILRWKLRQEQNQEQNSKFQENDERWKEKREICMW